MKLKRWLAKAARLLGKSPPAPASAEGLESPYARLREPALAAATVTPARTEVKDIFLLDRVTPWPLSTVGLFFPERGVALLRDPYRGSPGRLIQWNLEGTAYPLYGDWQGTGREAIGFFHRASRYFILWSDEHNEEPNIQFPFGPQDSNWLPLAGDWDGDGKHGVGFYDPDRGLFLIRNALSAPAVPETEFPFAVVAHGCLPLAGDWNGDGRDGIGCYDPERGRFYLRNALSSGEAETSFSFGPGGVGALPFAGRWAGPGARHSPRSGTEDP